MNWEILALISLVLAAIPCGLFLVNLGFYRRLPKFSLASGLSQVDRDGGGENRLSGFQSSSNSDTWLKPGAIEISRMQAVSVLIPARNEKQNLSVTLSSVLANRGVEFEVVVLDDHSSDRTAEIVRAFAAKDSRVRLEYAPTLLAGWCGKQHACHVLAQRANHPWLVFMDADVRLAPDALARMVGFMWRQASVPAVEGGFQPPGSTVTTASDSRDCKCASTQTTLSPPGWKPGSTAGRDAYHYIALASGVPRQELGTFSERLLLPLIHFVLLGYLPMFLMRWTRQPGFSAGCGQLFIARADAYCAIGGHAAIRATLHDGVKLPRAFRRAGFQTDLFDPTDIATCRMYHTNAETWRGLGKNATEGLAAPGAIVPMTLLLLGGQVLPFALLAGASWLSPSALWLAAAAGALAWLPRLISVLKFRQPFGAALLHPLGVAALLLIQWFALARSLAGRPAEWKGRQYAPQSVAQPARVA